MRTVRVEFEFRRTLAITARLSTEVIVEDDRDLHEAGKEAAKVIFALAAGLDDAADDGYEIDA